MFTESEIRELQPEPKPIIDLWLFIEEAKKGKYKIGVISQDVKEGFTQFKKGQLVLFEPYTAKELYGRMLYADVKKHCQLCTTCIPYLKKDKIYTASTCVCVPLSLISHEIKFEHA